jgi:hypothetical protein
MHCARDVDFAVFGLSRSGVPLNPCWCMACPRTLCFCIVRKESLIFTTPTIFLLARLSKSDDIKRERTACACQKKAVGHSVLEIKSR